MQLSATGMKEYHEGRKRETRATEGLSFRRAKVVLYGALKEGGGEKTPERKFEKRRRWKRGWRKTADILHRGEMTPVRECRQGRSVYAKGKKRREHLARTRCEEEQGKPTTSEAQKEARPYLFADREEKCGPPLGFKGQHSYRCRKKRRERKEEDLAATGERKETLSEKKERPVPGRKKNHPCANKEPATCGKGRGSTGERKENFSALIRKLYSGVGRRKSSRAHSGGKGLTEEKR